MMMKGNAKTDGGELVPQSLLNRAHRLSTDNGGA